MMPRKNIYIREEDQAIWDKAESLAGNDSVSRITTELLGEWTMKKEQEAAQSNNQFERIELEVSTTTEFNAVDGSRKIAFTGRELASGYNGDGFEVTVYETVKHQLLFYRETNNSFANYAEYKVYPDFKSAAEDYDEEADELVNNPELIGKVAEALNEEWVEELDI